MNQPPQQRPSRNCCSSKHGKHRLRAFLIYTVTLFSAACGKVGDPQPPFIRIPEAVQDLAAAQSGHTVILSWTNPRLYIDGSAATDLAQIRIESNGVPVATIKAAGGGQKQSYAAPILAAPDLEQRFMVVVETDQGKRSSASNIASIIPLEVPGPATGLQAVADQHRIFLQWQKPDQHPELADAYLVVRTDLPAEASTVADTRYEDDRYKQGASYTYQVTAVRRVENASVPGDGPAVVTISAEDKTPPSAPTGLEVTEAETGAYVTWNPNPETDVAGYRLFQSERPDAGFQPVTDGLIMSNGFVDASYRPGRYYAVSAVDESGNESARSAPFHGR